MKTRIFSLTFIFICGIALLPLCTAAASKPYLPSDTVRSNSAGQKHVKLKDVHVQGTSATKKLKQQGYAVDAISIKPQQNRLTTLKDIVDRSAGVKVRREGGLGSDYDLIINGLSGNAIRYFIDGIPMDTKGEGVNLDNIPLNTVERVELYKGVVPAYLGADALGGAVNIITKRQQHNYIDASYGGGSFNTHTADINAQLTVPGSKIVVRPTLSLSSSDNSYTMKDVEVWSEEESKYILANKRRFHDKYFSLFTQLEFRVTDLCWADWISLSASYSKVNKDIQTGAMQNKVYGDAERHEQSYNVALRYAKQWSKLRTQLDLSHTWNHSETVDTTFRKYDWDGTWLPSSGNEMNNKPKSIRTYKRPLTVVNAGVDYALHEGHHLALNYMMNRRENNRRDDVDKDFEPTNDVVTKHILSLTYSQQLFSNRWQNFGFIKTYINSTSIKQKDNSTITGADKIESDATNTYWGGGLGSRFTLCKYLSVKASYEHSVRLPLSIELLGNGTTIYPNLTLNAEQSNNYNAGLYGSWNIGRGHTLNYEANAYLRHVLNYIRAVVSERDGMMQYVNEPAIRIKGIDLTIDYTWRHALQIRANGTYNDARNLRKYKTDGNPSATYKNKVPNQPWIYGNIEGSYTFRNLTAWKDKLQIAIAHQWIHWYYLNWEAYGAPASKARIPTQNVTDIDLTYSWQQERYNLSLSCRNVFDLRTYDNYMLQKPGRAIYAKLRVFIN